VRDPLQVGMLQGLHSADSLALVQTEELLQQVDGLAGYNAGWGGLTMSTPSSQALTDLSQVTALTGLAQSYPPLVPGINAIEADYFPLQLTSWPLSGHLYCQTN